MYEAITLWVLFQQMLTFGPAPLADQVVEGRKLYQQGKGIERTLRQDRSVIGVWFDGRIKDEVESVIWVSPGMASRWLGYLEAREKWSKGEIQRRWSQIELQLKDKRCFVVRLSAMPKLVGLDMEIERHPDTEDIRNVDFRFTSGPGYQIPRPRKLIGLIRQRNKAVYPRDAVAFDPLPDAVEATKVVKLAEWKVRDRAKLDQYQWYQDLPLSVLFMRRGEEVEKDLGFGLGDYNSAWYWVEFDESNLKTHSGGFDLWVISANKERVGSFRF